MKRHRKTPIRDDAIRSMSASLMQVSVFATPLPLWILNASIHSFVLCYLICHCRCRTCGNMRTSSLTHESSHIANETEQTALGRVRSTFTESKWRQRHCQITLEINTDSKLRGRAQNKAHMTTWWGGCLEWCSMFLGSPAWLFPLCMLHCMTFKKNSIDYQIT